MEAHNQFYTEADHLTTFAQIEAIDYHTTHTISSIRVTPYPAGHVLGAAMFLIEIAGLKIFFTGDYSREDDRHLVSAEVPRGVKIDVLITESTYGIASHVPRVEREQALMKSVTSILNRGGRVLMPVFALGRAQELLLILDEYWGKHPEFQKIPIYYASNLARKCMLVYQTYVGSMNENIKRLFRERMAEAEANSTSGKDGHQVDKNGVIITGYSVEGFHTKISSRRSRESHDTKKGVVFKNFPSQLTLMVLRIENSSKEIAAPVVILVHGEQHNMMRLKSKLLSLNADKTTKVKVFSPKTAIHYVSPS
ncbi:hypothetical protein DID88_008365 [Monilinia fructigena]|uniref:Beta-Casp domain-containing protein n=1 Tax=Monilinia fructigena TaxID=38457 RepID=A0A395J543_9HELO|nr:hypothetical protein DID88_008365 [Monilinia fructigena]